MSPIRIFVVLASICGLLSSPGIAGGQTKQPAVPGLPEAILPAAPTDLLACLPPTPDGWTVTRSLASNSFAQALTVNADRDLKQNPPPPNPGAPSPAPPFVPGTLSIRLTDAGYSSNFPAAFTAPQSGTMPKNTTFLKLGAFPARKQKPDAATTIFSVLVKQRFLVEMRARNTLEKDFLDYVSHVNYQRLLAIPDTGPHDIPQPVLLTRVDELNPKGNRSYPVYWSSEAQVRGGGASPSPSAR